MAMDNLQGSYHELNYKAPFLIERWGFVFGNEVNAHGRKSRKSRGTGF
jgi:hypothetical protein